MSFDKLGRVNGPTILLASGKYFDVERPLDPAPEITDVAWGLATKARWSGQTKDKQGRHVFFSIAQHCVMGCHAAGETELKFAFLMHEVGEFIWGDLSSSLKYLVPEFKAWEKRTQKDLSDHWGVDGNLAHEVKTIDLRMMMTERRDLTSWDGTPWTTLDESVQPYSWSIDNCWSPEEAARQFLIAYHAYKRSDK